MSATIISMADFEATKAQAAQAAKFVRRPVSVLVRGSESDAWHDQQVLDYAEFEKEAAIVALGHAGRGYLKTHVTVMFSDDSSFDMRLDLAASDDLGIADHCLSLLQYVETEEGSQRLAEYPEHLRNIHIANLDFFRVVDFGLDPDAHKAARTLATLAEMAALLDQEKEAKAAAEEQKKVAAEQRAAEVARLAAGAPEYAHLVPLGEQDRGGVAAAKNVRRDLKKAFPGVKFSVKSSYTTINVSWQDGPTRRQVEDVIDKYQQGTFDGMTDCYEYHTSPFNERYGAVQYTFAERDHSEELRAAATRLIEQQSGETVTGDTNQRIWNDWASTLIWREAGRITLVDGVWHHDGEPIAWVDEQQQAEQVTIAPTAEPVATPAQVKPKFTAQQVGGVWSVTIAQGEERHQFDGIEAATLAEACRLAWAMLTQPTPPDDDPSGQPLPVEQQAEQAGQPDQGEQGAEAPTLTRAQLLGDYRGRVEGKRERLQVRAIKAHGMSDQRWGAAHAAVAGIPFGQPILVGHHSERRHRRAIERADQNMRQSIALDKKAKHLDSRAASVGHAGIASDDPEALQQLRAKLAEREQIQESFKAANKRQRGSVAAYRLSNNGAEIRRLRQRIEQIEQLHQAAPIEQEGNGWQMGEDDGRIVLAFDQRQPAEVVTVVKGAGFVYARSRTAWVRKVTANAVRAAERLAMRLAELLPA
ncbi:DUF3560 domain-containing protein [Aeromonas veronii]